MKRKLKHYLVSWREVNYDSVEVEAYNRKEAIKKATEWSDGVVDEIEVEELKESEG